jgi:hypothetical protein
MGVILMELIFGVAAFIVTVFSVARMVLGESFRSFAARTSEQFKIAPAMRKRFIGQRIGP